MTEGGAQEPEVVLAGSLYIFDKGEMERKGKEMSEKKRDKESTETSCADCGRIPYKFLSMICGN